MTAKLVRTRVVVFVEEAGAGQYWRFDDLLSESPPLLGTYFISPDRTAVPNIKPGDKVAIGYIVTSTSGFWVVLGLAKDQNNG